MPTQNSQLAQTAFLRAATAKAFTTVVAGFAFTIITLPKTSLLPALVAGFTRVLIMQRPWMVNLPFFTSLVATTAKLSSIFLATAGFTSVASASAAARPPFVMTAPALAFIAAFIAFIGAMATLEYRPSGGREQTCPC